MKTTNQEKYLNGIKRVLNMMKLNCAEFEEGTYADIELMPKLNDMKIHRVFVRDKEHIEFEFIDVEGYAMSGEINVNDLSSNFMMDIYCDVFNYYIGEDSGENDLSFLL